MPTFLDTYATPALLSRCTAEELTGYYSLNQELFRASSPITENQVKSALCGESQFPTNTAQEKLINAFIQKALQVNGPLVEKTSPSPENPPAAPASNQRSFAFDEQRAEKAGTVSNEKDEKDAKTVSTASTKPETSNKKSLKSKKE